MWVDLGIWDQGSLVRENVRDGSECHHDKSECRVGRVEAMGPVDDEMNAPI
jgi:hypothetical protein